MKIKTERLTLVPISEAFLDSACAYAMNADNARLMVYLPKESRDEVRDFLRSAESEWQKPQPDICEFAVLRDGEHIGGMTMYFEGDYTRGELGWIIRRDCWGKGYAVEAAKGLMEHFRKTMGLDRFIAHCDSENTASKRVMEKLGMHYVETHGGRFNRLTEGERRECLYEIIFKE
nr:GNAT family N-acetyltransferase [uncultured Ruminococcus sp.]